MATSSGSGSGRTLMSAAWELMCGPLVARACGRSGALGERDERAIVRAHVVRAGPDDLPVLPLLDDVGGPAGGPGEHEERREHRGGDAHRVVRGRAVPVEVREHP